MSYKDAKKFNEKDEQPKRDEESMIYTESLKNTLGFDVFIEELEKEQKEKDNG
jgi:hypothetical protein